MTTPLLILIFAALVASVALGFYRLFKGPSVVDRIIAFDAVVICAVALVVALSKMWHTPVFLELILIVSSLGFFSTVAFVYYFEKTEDETLTSESPKEAQ